MAPRKKGKSASRARSKSQAKDPEASVQVGRVDVKFAVPWEGRVRASDDGTIPLVCEDSWSAEEKTEWWKWRYECLFKALEERWAEPTTSHVVNELAEEEQKIHEFLEGQASLLEALTELQLDHGDALSDNDALAHRVAELEDKLAEKESEWAALASKATTHEADEQQKAAVAALVDEKAAEIDHLRRELSEKKTEAQKRAAEVTRLQREKEKAEKKSSKERDALRATVEDLKKKIDNKTDADDTQRAEATQKLEEQLESEKAAREALSQELDNLRAEKGQLHEKTRKEQEDLREAIDTGREEAVKAMSALKQSETKHETTAKLLADLEGQLADSQKAHADDAKKAEKVEKELSAVKKQLQREKESRDRNKERARVAQKDCDDLKQKVAEMESDRERARSLKRAMQTKLHSTREALSRRPERVADEIKLPSDLMATPQKSEAKRQPDSDAETAQSVFVTTRRKKRCRDASAAPRNFSIVRMTKVEQTPEDDKVLPKSPAQGTADCQPLDFDAMTFVSRKRSVRRTEPLAPRDDSRIKRDQRPTDTERVPPPSRKKSLARTVAADITNVLSPVPRAKRHKPTSVTKETRTAKEPKAKRFFDFDISFTPLKLGQS
ncbi:hypothetical protein DIPPA_12011 [Diplonema papillatum]|nr:hypothetical protein DIPPA_12011 [Diplonema papillatum]